MILEKFRKKRKESALTLEDVGRALGITKAAVQQIESGVTRLHPRHYEKITKLFGISESELLELIEESEFQGGKVKIGWMPNEKNAVDHFRSYLSFALKDEPLTDEERAKFRKILDKFDLNEIERFRTK